MMKDLSSHTLQDHIYKISKEGIQIPLRIWLPHDGRIRPLPTVIFLHGGGLITGTHYTPPSWLTQLFLPAGWTIVSLAYRFLPHVSIYDQIQDLADAVSYLRANLGQDLDMDRYVICGDSAGTTISGAALSAGIIQDLPCAWVPVAGGTNLEVQMYNPWYSEADRPPPETTQLPRDPSQTPIATDLAPGKTEAELRIKWNAADHRFTGREEKQYTYAAKILGIGPDGLVPKDGRGVLLGREMFRADTFATEEDFRVACRRLSPLHCVRNGTFPRIAVYNVQGEEDDWILPEWTKAFDEALQERGYIRGVSYIPGAKHGDMGSKILAVSPPTSSPSNVDSHLYRIPTLRVGERLLLPYCDFVNARGRPSHQSVRFLMSSTSSFMQDARFGVLM